jgi:hypothetical protein
MMSKQTLFNQHPSAMALSQGSNVNSFPMPRGEIPQPLAVNGILMSPREEMLSEASGNMAARHTSQIHTPPDLSSNRTAPITQGPFYNTQSFEKVSVTKLKLLDAPERCGHLEDPFDNSTQADGPREFS